MKMTASLLALACAATLPLALVAQTMSERHVLSVNFVDTRNKNSSFTPDGGNVGVEPVPYLGWNSVQTSTPNGTTLDFYDVDGQYSVLGTPTIEKDAPETWYLGSTWTSESNKVFYSDNNARLFGAYQDVRRTGNGGETTVTVRGLTATATYTLYIYPGTEGNGGTSGKMSSFQVETCGEDSEWSEVGKYKGNGLATVRAEALTETWGSYSNFRQYVQGTPIVWSEGINYLKVEGITGATGIQIRMPTWNREQRSGLAAFQLVGTFETRETAVPDGGLVPEVDTAIRVGDGKELILQGSSRTALEVVCVGSFTLRKGEYTGTLERLDFSHVQGDVITDIDLSQVGTVIWPQGNITMTGACAAGSADLVPAGKTLTTLGDVTVNTASGDDEGEFAFTRQNVGWVFGDGESTVSGRLVLADAGSATTTLTVQNGASLTVNSENITEGGTNGANGAVLFAHWSAKTTVTITGANSLFSVPNGVVNLAKDGNAQVNVTEGATFSAYKLNGDTNGAAESVMTVAGATLTLGKAGAMDGSLKMVEATLKLQDGATLTANGDWAIADGSTAGKIQLSGTVTVRPNGKTITLQKLALATDAEAATLVIDDSEADGYTQGGSVILKGAMPDGLTVKVKDATVQSNGAVVKTLEVEGSSTFLVSDATLAPMSVTGTLTLAENAKLTLAVADELSNTAVRCLVTGNGDLTLTSSEGHRVAYSTGAYYLLPNGSLTATVSGNVAWDSLTWTNGDGQPVDSPTLDGANVILKFSGATAVLTGAPADVTFATLALDGIGTISGALQCGTTSLRTGAAVTLESESANWGSLLVNAGATATLPKDTVYTNLDNLGTVKVGVITKALTVESGTFVVTGKSMRTDASGGDTVVNSGARLEIAEGGRLYAIGDETHVSSWKVRVYGTLKTREWQWGDTAFGQFAHNTGNTIIDGGTVEFVDDIGTGEGTRGFTIGAGGATLVIAKGNRYRKINNSDANISFSSGAGTLTLSGEGTFVLEQTTLTGKVALSEGATLSGASSIGTLAFDSGTMLDATDPNKILTATDLEMPAEGTVTVKVVEGAEPGTVLLKKAEPAVADAKKFVVGDVNNAYVTAQTTGDTIGFVLGRMTTADTDGHNPASGSKLAGILADAQAAAIENGITSVNLVYGQCGGETLTAAQAEAGAELFSNVVTTTTEGSTTTVTVAYDFGISKMAIRDIGETRYVIVGAKVQGAEGADFAETTEVQVLVNGAVAGTAEAVAAADVGETAEVGVKWFRLPYADVVGAGMGASSLTVKALPQATTP